MDDVDDVDNVDFDFLNDPKTEDIDIESITIDRSPIESNYYKFKQDLNEIENKHLIIYLNGANYLISKLDDIIFNDFHKLYHLNLSNNRLIDFPNEVFSQLFNLEILDLSYNLISILDNSIFRNNRFLQIIQLNNNLMTLIDFSAFNSLNFLRVLNVSYNQIEIISGSFLNCIFLEQLDLSYNQIVHIDVIAFSCLINLIKLKLNNNRLSHLDNSTFIVTTKLEYLNLSNNFIKELSENIFFNMENLKILDLSQNLLESIDRVIFSCQPNLENLNLLNNEISNIDKESFFVSRDIRELKLELHYYCESNVIRDLKLLCDLEIIIKSTTIINVDELLLNNLDSKTIKRLHLVFQKGTFLLKGAFRFLENVEFLHIEFLERSKKKFQLRFSNYVNRLLKLKHLAFRNINNFRFSYNILTNTNNITYLDFTGISNKSIDFLLGKFDFLEYLNLSFSKIHLLPVNTMKNLLNLKYLILTGSKISEIKSQTFYFNTKLEEIDCKNCQIRKIEENAFLNLKNLKRLDLRGNVRMNDTQDLFNSIPESVLVYYNEIIYN